MQTLLPLLFLAALGACSNDTSAGAPATLVALRADGTPLEFESAPQRIVAANAAALEFLAALVDPTRIVALPAQAATYSNVPVDQPAWESIPTFSEYSAESLLTYEPDLIVTHIWQDPVTSSFLREQDLGVAILPDTNDPESLRNTIQALGALLHAEERARELIDSLERRRATLAEIVRDPQPSALSYTNYGTGGWTAGSGTPEDFVLRLAGFRNAAAEAQLSRHAEVDLELLIRLDPDVLVVCAAGEGTELSGTRAYLDQEPALAELRAIREGHVVVLPVRLYSTTSHHVFDAAEEVAAQVARFEPVLTR